MKKVSLVIGLILITFLSSTAQNNPKNDDFDDISKQMAQMQKQMMEQMKKMFGNSTEDSDSTQNFNFSFKNMPFGQIDTALTQSFGMLFDGQNWHNLSPNGDSTMDEQMRELRERMPDFGKGFDMKLDDMLKGFSSMFKEGFPMPPNTDDMPRIQPKEKKQKSEEPKSNKKYKTESL